MKYFLIYNPVSKSGKSKKSFSKILFVMKENKINFDYVFTSRKDEAIDLAKNITKDNYDVIVPVGGDGTICEAITGLMHQSKEQRPKLGVLHVGTSPDFNRYHNLPVKLEEAVDVLFKAKTKEIDVGKITHLGLDKQSQFVSYFGSSVNIGLGPSIASKSNGRYRKYLGDFLGTLSSTLVSLAGFNPINLRLRVDGEREELKDVFNLTIGKDPYLASGMRIPIEIKEDSGRMYILAIQGKHKPSLLANLWRLYSGNILDYKGSKFRYCKEVEVFGNENEKLEFDGDFRGYLPAKIEVLPTSLEILVR
ncbi:MAG: hypothetical protein KKF67_03145 [Nanoarchaeota archaeon]|nr:hypothetical protein [Nanoarchaeota archaeon]